MLRCTTVFAVGAFAEEEVLRLVCGCSPIQEREIVIARGRGVLEPQNIRR